MYKHFETREDWLAGRKKFPGIGASEAAAIVGASNWQSPLDLWKLKVGLKEPKDLSDDEYVQYGIRAEEHFRALFMLKHEEFTLSYRPFDFLFLEERPWLRCTLDGELTFPKGEHGILEIKTATIQSKGQYSHWKDGIPDAYLCQILHQWLATEFQFTYVFAELSFLDGTSSLRTYYFRREDYIDELDWLLKKEVEFWENVQMKKAPSSKLFI